MLEKLKNDVYKAHLSLVKYNLVVLTWGNVSAISSDRQLIVIKPSGVDYSTMRPEQMVIVDLDGKVVEGRLRPSSDLPTHLEIYRNVAGVNSVVHTHSLYATAFAQAEMDLPCYGTTHADHFYGSVPCTRALKEAEVADRYELNTGKVIVETFRERNIDPMSVPAVLVCKHGPFTWGADPTAAVENALVLDETAHMALLTGLLPSKTLQPAPQYLQDKHYYRKHGGNAYYGQQTNY